jgi:hypothetical protein
VITATLAFVAGALLTALSGVIGDEVRGWLELAPRGILRLVALRLPAGSREAIYKEEWLPELVFILHEAEGGPITRAARATWFAVSLAGAAAEIGRALREGRNEAEAAVHVEPNPVIIQIGADLAAVVLAGDKPTAAAYLCISLLPVD